MRGAVLGISAHYHDSAAALLVDGQPICAVQEERLSRKKGDASFPAAAIDWCLERAGLEPESLDAVVFYEKPMLKFERILAMALRAWPRAFGSFAHAMKRTLGERLWVKGTIAAHLGVPGRKILFCEHHLSHAAMAFFTAPTDEAAILTADGVGEWATLTFGRGRKNRAGPSELRLLREVRFPHSLGMLYSTFTAFLGFAVNEGEYKVMGLASFGRPRFAREVEKLLVRAADGGFQLDLRYFDFHAGVQSSWSPAFEELFGPPRREWEPLDPRTPEGQRFADIAASVQLALENVLVDLAARLKRETGLDDLCLGGGVALNGCANARILREAGFARVFVPCAPGDAGCALGAALYADRVWFGRPHADVRDHSFLGPEVDGGELLRLAQEDGLPARALPDVALIAQVADALCAGKIVGWMEGAGEYGPRALGHRSILALPGPARVRDAVNRSIKFREEFRPFAPAVLAGHAARCFELPPGGERLARFMSGIFPVRDEFRDRLAAVTHVDGTARLQIVDRATAPRFAALLEAVGARTGLPVLLNTSFNLAGEPIVSSAAEGYSTFCRSGIDLLVAGSTVASKAGARASGEEAA